MNIKSIQDRLDFYNLAENDDDYRGIAQVVRKHGRKALDNFYSRVRRNPAISHYFPTSAGADRARSAQLAHWQSIFDEGLGQAYIDRANQIGMVHARINLDPRWYIGAYATIVTELLTEQIAGGWRGLIPGNRALARRITKLARVAMLDVDIALATYFSKAEEDIRTAMAGKVETALSAMAGGDLTVRVSGLPRGYEQLELHLNESFSRFNDTLNAIASGTKAISSGTAEIGSASGDLARRTEQQAASLAESAAAISEINIMAQATAGDVGALNQSVSKVLSDAANGSDIVRNAISAMNDIQISAKSIANIIEVIDGIAFQTNLLALNAGVEAARVGAEGQGFAVVANEVRALAQRSAEAAEEIKGLVNKSLTHVDNGAGLVSEAGTALNVILEQISHISNAASRIASASQGQSANLAQINVAVTEMDRMTQQNAAMVEQSNAAARTMAQEVGRLEGVVDGFRTTPPGFGGRTNHAA
jgi:methyl-accepting chemotaxis protein